LLFVAAHASFGGDQLQEWIDTHSWSQGTTYCNQGLEEDLSRRTDLRNLSTDYLSRLAVDCAALASGMGDESGAGWWWYTAVSLDAKTALALLPDMRQRGLLEKLPPPRKLVLSFPLPPSEENKVRLLSGEAVPGTPPRQLSKPKVPGYMFRPITGVKGASVAIEAVVSKEGVLQQPLLLDAKALPVHVFFAYRFLSTWRFEPAKVNGHPVECLYALTVGIQRQ
jgi:hypothetical protein